MNGQAQCVSWPNRKVNNCADDCGDQLCWWDLAQTSFVHEISKTGGTFESSSQRSRLDLPTDTCSSKNNCSKSWSLNANPDVGRESLRSRLEKFSDSGRVLAGVALSHHVRARIVRRRALPSRRRLCTVLEYLLNQKLVGCPMKPLPCQFPRPHSQVKLTPSVN